MINIFSSKYVLKDSEVNEFKQKGLIAHDIESLCTAVTNCARDKNFYGNAPSPSFLQSLGIRESFVYLSPDPSFYFDSYYLTDLFLIRCSAVKTSYDKHLTYSTPTLSFIPLEYIEKCELQFERNDSGYIPPTFATKKKSPVKGAVIGGVLAGPTGAVIGAAAGSGEKTVMTSSGRRYNDDRYTFVLKIKDCDLQREKGFDKRPSSEEVKTANNRKNENARRLIENAKALTDLESKKKAVETTILAGKALSASSGQKYVKSNNSSDTIGIIIAVVAGLAFLVLMAAF